MANPSKQKGNRLERELVKLLVDAGLNAKRIPLSGSVKGFEGDILIDGLTGECKGRRDGFKQLYGWLDERDILFLRADKKGWLVVQPLDDWLSSYNKKRRTKSP